MRLLQSEINVIPGAKPNRAARMEGWVGDGSAVLLGGCMWPPWLESSADSDPGCCAWCWCIIEFCITCCS